MEATKTLKLRIKDKHAAVLSLMAREVNQVWNYCNARLTGPKRPLQEHANGQ